MLFQLPLKGLRFFGTFGSMKAGQIITFLEKVARHLALMNDNAWSRVHTFLADALGQFHLPGNHYFGGSKDGAQNQKNHDHGKDINHCRELKLHRVLARGAFCQILVCHFASLPLNCRERAATSAGEISTISGRLSRTPSIPAMRY